MTRRACMIGLAALALGAAGPRETPLAEPRPSMDAPRRIVISIAESDPARVNAVLTNIVNIQSFYGQDFVRIMVVGYGPGVRQMLRHDSEVAPRIASLQVYDVEFVACGATLDALGLGPDAVLPDIAIVQNGLPEIVERVAAGWVHLRP